MPALERSLLRASQRLGRLVPLALGLALGPGGVACSSQRVLREVRGERPRVIDVHLQGVHRFSERELLGYLHVGEHDWVPFTRDHEFDEAVAAVDARRLEELYRSYGYYQARVLSVEAVPRPDEEGEVDVLVRVEEGQPTRVTALEVRWAESVLTPGERQAVERRGSLRVGGPFEVARLNASLGDLRIELLRRGFPLAAVTGTADVHEGARRAEVRLQVTPGPRARIRSVRFEGLYGVPRAPLDVEVRFALGQLYSPNLTHQMEEALKALRVFRWVAVTPPTEVHDGQVDLVVRVSESDPQSVSVGPEVSIDSVRWQQTLTAAYTHVNLFGELTRLDLRAAAGYAELPNPWAARRLGTVARLAPTLTRKGLLEDFLIWTLAPSVGVDVQEGYNYWVAGNRVGASRWFEGALVLSLDHNLKRYDYFHQSATLDTVNTALGRDFRDPYLLSFVELDGSLYLTDSIARPTEGLVFDATGDLAGGGLGGDFSYTKALVGVRGYVRPWRRLQLVARVQGGSIFPYGEDAGAPLAYKFYLGGANAMRGFGARRLSPSLRECVDADCSVIPIGGYSMAQGTFEARFLLAGPLSLVGFGEVGDVRADAFSYGLDTLNYTAGPGLRIETPLGLVRGDFGFRLNRLEAYPDDAPFAFYVGLGEAL